MTQFHIYTKHMKALLFTISIIISIPLSFYIFFKSKNPNVSQEHKKIAKYILIFTSVGWIAWTLGLSTLFVGYPIKGWLFNYQISLIIGVITVSYVFYRSKIKDKKYIKDIQSENIELLKKLSLAENDKNQINNEVLNQAIVDKLQDSLFAIDTLQSHREWLEKTIKTAKYRVCILSGWATSFVIDDNFRTYVKDALERGVKIYLGFGYQSSEKKINNSHENKAAELLWELREWCQNLEGDGEIEVFEFANHAKVLIKDDEYVVIGSFNWLSNSRGRNLERSWVIKDKKLVDTEFDEIISIMEKLRKVEKRHFIKKFIPGLLKK